MSDFCTKAQQLGKGISNPARYTIVEALMAGPKTVSELVDIVKLSQPAVSQHLGTLKTCGLVSSAKKGQEVEYVLNARHMLEILRGLTTDVSKCKNYKPTESLST